MPTCHLQSVSFEDAVGSYLRPYISTVKGCSYLRFALALMRDSPSSGLREGCSSQNSGRSTVQSEADTRREGPPPWAKEPASPMIQAAFAFWDHGRSSSAEQETASLGPRVVEALLYQLPFGTLALLYVQSQDSDSTLDQI